MKDNKPKFVKVLHPGRKPHKVKLENTGYPYRIQKFLNEMVYYMADELCLEGEDENATRACQLSDAAVILKKHLKGSLDKKGAKAELIHLEHEIENNMLWKRMPQI
jgi:hypothetical protein